MGPPAQTPEPLRWVGYEQCMSLGLPTLPESDLVTRKSANRFRETFDNLICYDYLLAGFHPGAPRAPKGA